MTAVRHEQHQNSATTRDALVSGMAVAAMAVAVSWPVGRSYLEARIGFGGAGAIWIGSAAALLLATFVWPRLAPVRRLDLAVIALLCGRLAEGEIAASHAFAAWASHLSPIENYLASTALNFAPPVLMVAVALAAGTAPRDMYLTKGRLTAPSGLRWRGRAISWLVIGLTFTSALLIEHAVHYGGRLTAMPAHALASALPLALLFTVLNALEEEVTVRCVLLPQLTELAGFRAAALLTSMLFALIHWNKHGAGQLLTLAAGPFLTGLVYAYSMRRTRGLGWAWIAHAAADLPGGLVVAGMT